MNHKDDDKNEIVEAKVIEQNIDFPEFDEEDLIRMDMNIIEYPLFSINKRRGKNNILKYFFNNNKSKFIEIHPSANDITPGAFEKSVFIALTRILKDRGYPTVFVTTAKEVLNNMEISETSKKRLHSSVKEAIERMGRTSYVFNNTLYSSKEKKLLKSRTTTKILEVTVLTKTDLKNVNEKDKEEKLKYFSDKRIKEVFIISFGNYFYDNIITKGYLVYSAPELLGLRTNDVALSLYMRIVKLRRDELFFRIGLLKLASTLGFKIEQKNFSRTKESINNACKLLMEKELILNYEIQDSRNWKSSYIDFYFSEHHNKVRQNNFITERNLFEDIYISETDTFKVHIDNDENDIVDSNILIRHEVTKNELEFINSLLQYQIKRLKTIGAYLEMVIPKYGVERVAQAAIYTKQHAKTKPFDYFKKSIEFNYGSKIEINLPRELLSEKIERETGVKPAIKEVEIKNIYSSKIAFEKFMELNRTKQLLIIEKAIDDTIKKAIDPNMPRMMKEAMEIDIKKRFNDNPEKEISDWLFETKYFENLEETKKEENKNDIIHITEEDKNIKQLFENKKIEFEKVDIIEESKKEIVTEVNSNIVNPKEMKEYINNAINLYAELMDLAEEEIVQIKKDIVKLVLPLAMQGTLTKEKLNQLVQTELDKI